MQVKKHVISDVAFMPIDFIPLGEISSVGTPEYDVLKAAIHNEKITSVYLQKPGKTKGLIFARSDECRKFLDNRSEKPKRKPAFPVAETLVLINSKLDKIMSELGVEL